MNTDIRRYWKAAVTHTLTLLGIGLAGVSVGGDYDDYDDWLGIG